MEAFLRRSLSRDQFLRRPGFPPTASRRCAPPSCDRRRPGFIKDAEKSRLEVSPTSGEEVERVIADITRVPPA